MTRIRKKFYTKRCSHELRLTRRLQRLDDSPTRRFAPKESIVKAGVLFVESEQHVNRSQKSNTNCLHVCLHVCFGQRTAYSLAGPICSIMVSAKGISNVSLSDVSAQFAYLSKICAPSVGAIFVTKDSAQIITKII